MKFLKLLAIRETFMTMLFLMSIGLFCFCFREWYLGSVVPEVEWARENGGKVLAVVGQIAEGEQPAAVGEGLEVKDENTGAQQVKYIYYDVELSQELQAYTQNICGVFNVPFELALAVMKVESEFKPDAVNGRCVGLFQINLDYAAIYYENLNITDVKEPRDNILSGVWYLSKLMAKHEDLNLALMHYNLGNKADKFWGEGIRETEYTQRVIAAEMGLVIDIVQED